MILIHSNIRKFLRNNTLTHCTVLKSFYSIDIWDIFLLGPYKFRTTNSIFCEKAIRFNS